VWCGIGKNLAYKGSVLVKARFLNEILRVIRWCFSFKKRAFTKHFPCKPNLFREVICTAIFAISLFWPKYRRIEHENGQKHQQVFKLDVVPPRSFYTEEID
jgi:hypothetical protein